MKKFLIGLCFLLFCGTVIFAQNYDDSSRIKTPEEMMKNFEVTEETEELEEFSFPTEKKSIKNTIKVDVGTPVSMGLFTFYDLVPTDMNRIPLLYEYTFNPYAAIQLEMEAISYFILPNAFGISAGISCYPLGKAPSDLFISVRGGGAVGLFYAYSVQAGLGWQFVIKEEFVISLSGEFAYYFKTTGDQFYIPSIGISLGWGF